MNSMIKTILASIRQVLSDEEGQDLVEYALVVGLIALAATAGMQSLAESINNGFFNNTSTFIKAISPQGSGG